METTFTAIIGLVIGIFISFYDKKSGKKLYHKWYNISNKNKLDPNTEIGFVTNQLFGQKLTVALIITGISYVIGFMVFGINPISGIFYMIAYFLGLMVAFYTSSLLLSLFSKKVSKTIEYIENVEKGNIDLKAEAKKGYEKVKDKLEDVVESVKETVTGKDTEELKQEIPKKEEKESPKEENKDWKKGINDFLDK